jgi:DNA-binding response OmpR family regulator
VETAATGGDGLAMAEALRPSLIVLDINLPDMSGWDVLNALEEAAPVIVHSVDDNRKRALAAGACEHLLKPADRDVLAAAALRFAKPGQAPATPDAVATSAVKKTA